MKRKVITATLVPNRGSWMWECHLSCGHTSSYRGQSGWGIVQYANGTVKEEQPKTLTCHLCKDATLSMTEQEIALYGCSDPSQLSNAARRALHRSRKMRRAFEQIDREQQQAELETQERSGPIPPHSQVSRGLGLG